MSAPIGYYGFRDNEDLRGNPEELCRKENTPEPTWAITRGWKERSQFNPGLNYPQTAVGKGKVDIRYKVSLCVNIKDTLIMTEVKS